VPATMLYGGGESDASVACLIECGVHNFSFQLADVPESWPVLLVVLDSLLASIWAFDEDTES